ncbi:MAG: hypothetical protein U0T33_13585 [Bacteroidales bacterium]
MENIHIGDINMINIPNEAVLFDLFYGGKDPGASNPGVAGKWCQFHRSLSKHHHSGIFISATSPVTGN